ncbi:hypothetical protein MTO98_01855 [Mucilaginibacter sp. SMC90]|uniref:hypothetical protein n=1 Tax=Mucilaginibacter sp. SMC90 TaxID=2929803 RepID=UPI001FB3F743|nr:hypothetical protein [Mucilaginibacter sp. SMC90]UOE49815.1 hypothetical protein MTO98_01855 [Mucilaginibacter sp. SMC90]
MFIQSSLFDASQFQKRKAPAQADFENKNLDVLIAFRDMVPRAFARLHKEIFSTIEPISQDKNLPSVVMSGFLKGELIKHFPQLCGHATKQRFQLTGAGNERIFIKKLDTQMRPSNIPTVDSVLIYNQLSNSHIDVFPNIFLGYTASEDWSDFTGVYAVCIDGEKTLWISDLMMLDDKNGSNIVTMPVQPIVPVSPKIKEGVVKIKKKAE